MAIRINLAPAILVPMAATLLGVVGLTMFLSSLSNLQSVENTLSGQQDKMIAVLATKRTRTSGWSVRARWMRRARRCCCSAPTRRGPSLQPLQPLRR
jgi:hypothetical protein